MVALFIAKPPSIWASLSTRTVFSHISYLQIPKYPLIRTGFSFYSENRVTEFHRPCVRVPHLLVSATDWGGSLLGKTHPLVLCSGLLIWAANSFLSFATSQNVVGNSTLLSAIRSLRIQNNPTVFTTPGKKLGSWVFSSLQNVLFNQKFALLDWFDVLTENELEFPIYIFKIHSLCNFSGGNTPPFSFPKKNLEFFALLPSEISVLAIA